MEMLSPMDIEKRSFEIITQELGEIELDPLQAPIIKRVIHASADFGHAENMCFSENAVEIAIDVLRHGADIVTDTQMAKAGISKGTLKKAGIEVHCFISDADVARQAADKGTTRAAICIEKASKLVKPLIIVVGNAPTALVELDRLIRGGKMKPKLVIGVPVGFVNVVEAKELIMESGIPYIVAKGRKGGSNIAAAIVNALLYMAFPREPQL
jgi:precorrin-8X/cobalt-precorrin-8 methylmutase